LRKFSANIKGINALQLALALLLISLLFILPAKTIGASVEGPKIVVIPFDMHAGSDISEVRKELMEALAASLANVGCEITGMDLVREMILDKGKTTFSDADAIALAIKANANFVILGSITELGTALSADWRIIDPSGERPLRFYHKDAPSAKELIYEVKESSNSMYKRMAMDMELVPTEESDTLQSISIEGLRRLDPEAVTKKLLSKIGDPYSADTVRTDIHSIFSMGYFSDITADLKDMAAGKSLTFTVKEKAFVKNISLSGRVELDETKIMDILTIKENTILDHALVKEEAERIRILYESDGFYLATVEPDITTDGIEASINFKINEGNAVKVRRIKIIGNKAFSDRKILKKMETKKAGFFSYITKSGKYNEYVFDNDLRSIIKLYNDKGYINAVISDKSVLLDENKKFFHISIAIDEGAQFRLGDIKISGEILTTEEDLLDNIDIKEGDIFNKSELSRGLRLISSAYGDKGWANASVQTDTRINEEEGTVDLYIDITKNDLVYIERIDISGNTRTRDKVIRRELDVTEGDLYSTSGIRDSTRNLRRLGYFQSVKIEESAGTTPTKVKLDVDLTEQPTGAFTFGLGYSSVDKVIATAGISQSNLLGTGLVLNLSTTLSASSSRYNISFTDPWLFDKPISGGIDLFNTEKEYEDFTMESMGFGLRLGVPITKRTTRLYLSYKYENVEVSDVDLASSQYILDQEGDSTVSSVSATLVHDSRDDIFFPREGLRLSVSTLYAGDMLGGSTNFANHTGSIKKYFPTPYNSALSFKASAGFVQRLSSEPLPIYNKFYMGGINSLRGFESRSVGPRDPITGELIGGESKFLFSTELVFPLFPEHRMNGVIFADTGNTFDGGIDFGDLREGAGFGIRWYSPMGPVRIEWATNLDPETGEKSSLWEFTMGGSF
jgi:outer membrane protein insertion porin family